jgi:hypothetical protein
MRNDEPRADAGLVAGVELAGFEPEPARPAREFLSIKEALATYGFSRSFLYELMGRGLVRSAKVGRRRLVHAPTLRAFVCSRMDGADGHGGVARRVPIEEVVGASGGPGRRGREAARHRAAPDGPEGCDRPSAAGADAGPESGGVPAGGADAPRQLPTAKRSGRRRP